VRSLALILRQAATTILVEDPEIGLCESVALVGGELVEACRLALILRQAATTILVEEPEIGLSESVAWSAESLKSLAASRSSLGRPPRPSS
jgi:hypothetical protein